MVHWLRIQAGGREGEGVYETTNREKSKEKNEHVLLKL